MLMAIADATPETLAKGAQLLSLEMTLFWQKTSLKIEKDS